MNATTLCNSLSPQTGQATPARKGFSVTELLVVIGIIVLLIGILLPALGVVRGKALATQTQSTMQEFAKACENYQQEFGHYPGVVPERFIAADPQITGTENAILALMGGYVRAVDFPAGSTQYDNDYVAADGWEEISFSDGSTVFDIKVNVNLIGEGPVVNGEQFPPFYAPKGDEVRVVEHIVPGLSTGGSSEIKLPDLVDAWGQPIVYLRSLRSSGVLVGDLSDAPQFAIGSTLPYIEATELGEMGKSQIDFDEESIINSAPAQDATVAQLIRHPGFGDPYEPLFGTAEGKFVLLSAGEDGIYFSRSDGPGTRNQPIDDIVTKTQLEGGPILVREYDDIRIFGGG